MADLETRILEAFENNVVGEATRNIPWLFSVCETAHFIGLCLIFGSLLLVDLRILGVAKGVGYWTVLKLVPVAILGFVINLVSGLILFTNSPEMYWPNPLFKVKLALIALAGVNALWFTFFEQPRILSLPQGARLPGMVRATAALSLSFWLLVIVAGRLLPTFETFGLGFG